MTSSPDIEAHRRTAEQAAQWLLTLQSEELAPEQRAALVEWLCESPQHVSALFRMCKLQRDLSRFGQWAQLLPLTRTSSSKVMRLVPRSNGPAPLRSPRWGRAATGAVCAALLGVAGWIGLGRLSHQNYSTAAGEKREITLADGSVMDLSPNTEVAVRYRARERLITLDHGDALFHVAKNTARPFIVTAARTRVRAVGTIFRVQRTPSQVRVAVVEGVVAVSEEPEFWHRNIGPAPALPLLSLAANEQVSINPTGWISPVHWTSVKAAGAAGDNQLTFEDQTVAEVAGRFNRHNRIQIEISDPSLAARRISGIFPTNDPQSFVDFLKVAADVHISQRDSTHLLLGSPADGKDRARR